MTEVEQLKTEIKKLKARNQKVEINKALELSLTRKIILMILTYIVIAATLTSIKNPQPFTNAIIPTIALFLSTLSLPILRNIWQKYIYNK